MATSPIAQPRLVKANSLAEGKARFKSQFKMFPEIDPAQVRQEELDAANQLLRKVSRMSIHGESDARMILDRLFPTQAS